ncbi:MAG: hypothetical protein R3A51_01345 [Nannocystaceae bacterium]|nr:hypothetical protein [Myxococcales bacterium]
MSPRWTSQDPDKARAERFFLLYTPIWIGAVALVMLGGYLKRWGDLEYLLFGVGIAAPLLLVPALTPGEGPFYRRYWFKFNLWIALYVCAGSYVGTHYFFDVMGMRYAFPTTISLDAALVGHDTGEVPLFLYPLTQCYFVTYHTIMVMTLRRLRTGPLARLPGKRLWWTLALVAVAYGCAYGETYFMTHESLSDYFWYLDRDRMLSLGSLFYATYFVVSAPLVGRIDEPEDVEGAPLTRERWSVGRVALEALAASMLMFYALDLWTQLFGPLIEG